MATIDSLIALLETQKADGLVLAPGKVPALLIGGGRQPLTMPAVDAALVQAMWDEIATADATAAMTATGIGELAHEAPRVGRVTIEATRGEGGPSLKIRDGKTHLVANQIQTGAEDGMWSLDRSLVDLARRGLIGEVVALATARDREYVQRALR